MRRQEKIIQQLKREAGELEIPKGITPEEMRRKLEYMEEWRENDQAEKKDRKIRSFPVKQVGAAACILFVLLGAAAVGMQGGLRPDTVSVPEEQKKAPTQTEATVQQETEMYPGTTYEDIYAAMLPTWKQQGWFAAEDAVPDEVMDFAEMAIPEAPAEEESVRAESASKEMMNSLNVAADDAVGSTNVQTVGVDEGDIVKNDGRYLYQIVYVPAEDGWEYAIQIVDTRDGLKEISRIGGFENIREFYVTDGCLIVIENKYKRDDSGIQAAKSRMYAYCDVLWHENYYHEITFYDLSNHVIPRKIKTFTLDGRYESSRVAGGYFYGFSRFYAVPGEGEEDYAAYVPSLEGKPMEAEQILLPDGSTGTSYLVLISVDLKNPKEIFRSTAVVSEGNLFYVSGENIYVTWPKSAEGEDGWVSDTTSILRFGYGAGRFVLQAEGEVKGNLNDSFSLDEYNGYLRVVSTVREYRLKKLIDDRTGKPIGSSLEEDRQTNALYVLNPELETVGAIEGLAEEEQIYSARFLGDVGYFVTFRQTDPLFAVDLKDPANPKILSELKINGFSEYLHFYGEDRLLGIGMEADENTGVPKGMKLSMFDISDPGNVTEVQKLWLKDYNHSEALYNHRAVLISTGANLFGFEAEGSGRGDYWKEYLLFSYEDETFVTRLKLNTKTEDGYYQSRGTFIGDCFYLLTQDGSVRSYNWRTGEKLESLEK